MFSMTATHSLTAVSSSLPRRYADHDSVTVEMVIGNLKANASLAQTIVRGAISAIAAQRPASIAHGVLKDAIMTPKDFVPAATRRKLDLFTTQYWGKFE